MNVKNGVCGVQFDRRDIPMNKFVVTCLESQFHVFDARTQHPQKVRAVRAAAAAAASNTHASKQLVGYAWSKAQ
jgi:hypothetical protein